MKSGYWAGTEKTSEKVHPGRDQPSKDHGFQVTQSGLHEFASCNDFV